MEKFYIVLVVLIASMLCILCFIPLSGDNGFFKGYNQDEKKEEAEKKEVEDKRKEEIIDSNVDSITFKRILKDVVYGYFNALKAGEFKEANKFLSSKKEYTNKTGGVSHNLSVNSKYNFFNTYLNSYNLTVEDVVDAGENAYVTIKLKRYDINALVAKLIKKQQDNIEDYQNATYEELIFEYEKFLRDEFMKTNVPMVEDEYKIKLVFEKNEWKIVSDDDFSDLVINMKYRIVDSVKKSDEDIKKEN